MIARCSTALFEPLTRKANMADSFIWWRSNHGHAAAQMVYFQWTEAMPSLRVLILPEEYCAPLTQHVSPPPLLVLLLRSLLCDVRLSVCASWPFAR